MRKQLDNLNLNNKLASAIEQSLYSVNNRIMTPLLTGEKALTHQADLGRLIEKETRNLLKSSAMDKIKVMRNNLLGTHTLSLLYLHFYEPCQRLFCIEKDEYRSRIKLLESKLSRMDPNNLSQEEIDRSLGLLPINEKSGNKVSMTFEDRVRSFEVGLDERNKQAEMFVK